MNLSFLNAPSNSQLSPQKTLIKSELQVLEMSPGNSGLSMPVPLLKMGLGIVVSKDSDRGTSCRLYQYDGTSGFKPQAAGRDSMAVLLLCSIFALVRF